MILFINACNRRNSRTKILADYLLSKLNDNIKQIDLIDFNFNKTDEDFLKHRDELIENKKYDDKLFTEANDFSKADIIVICAPYYDLSFPAILKQYFEHINILGITFKYSDEGYPIGLCKAKKIYYITTSGGNYTPDEYGYGYIKALANGFYGIEDVEYIKATGLDIIGADEKQILTDAYRQIDNILNK